MKTNTNLLNSLPNAVLISAAKQGFKSNLRPLKVDAASFLLETGFNSFVGHESFSQVLSSKLGIVVETKRAEYSPSLEDGTILALVSPTRRLAEGEKWTEQELLSMPVNFFLLTFSI